jgi:hypothetical protein
MINSNFYKFLEAVKYLHFSADANIAIGNLMAPAEIYYVINATEKSFDEVISAHNLNGEV